MIWSVSTKIVKAFDLVEIFWFLSKNCFPKLYGSLLKLRNTRSWNTWFRRSRYSLNNFFFGNVIRSESWFSASEINNKFVLILRLIPGFWNFSYMSIWSRNRHSSSIHSAVWIFHSCKASSVLSLDSHAKVFHLTLSIWSHH